MAPQGIQDTNVTLWFHDHVPEAVAPLQFDLIAGGHSNLTYLVTDAEGARWVLRRPPLHQVLATAHDMEREHRILAALAGSAVPVPRVRGLCTDPDVNDRPFYVMDHVDGIVVRSGTVARTLDPDVRAHASRSVIDVLAAIHAVDPDAVGLGDLGKREDYIARQLRRWLRQYGESATRDRPIVQDIHDQLAATIPHQTDGTIVHGDYRLDNCIITPSGDVAAVLDWELCTLGEPLVDLAQVLVYWVQPGDQTQPLADPPTAVDGFASHAALVARYEQVSGRSTGNLDYYLAFASWRLACILEGVYSRYVGGAMGEESGTDAEDFVGRIDSLLASASTYAARVAP